VNRSLVDYRTEVISGPLRVVNPDYRHLDGKVRSATGKLTRRLAKFAAITLEEPIKPKHVEPFVRRKAALQEPIETLQHELDALKAKRKETPHHATVDELPEEARFRQRSTHSKQLLDTIKMIAYRAEPAKVCKPVLVVEEAGRAVVSALDDAQAAGRRFGRVYGGTCLAEIEPGPFSPLFPSWPLFPSRPGWIPRT